MVAEGGQAEWAIEGEAGAAIVGSVGDVRVDEELMAGDAGKLAADFDELVGEAAGESACAG